jgi:hypothetical protein
MRPPSRPLATLRLEQSKCALAAALCLSYISNRAPVRSSRVKPGLTHFLALTAQLVQPTLYGRRGARLQSITACEHAFAYADESD